MAEYKVTAGPLASRKSIAKWLLTLPGARSVPVALNTADSLLRGCELKMLLSTEEVEAAGDICSFEEILWENPWVKHMKEQEEYFALCKRGAAGDVEAAIAYCKLEVAGTVKHGGMG
jgi:hypothetical protein